MNKQEVFETMVRGLAAQGWQQSLDSDGCCAYRGANGMRCAAGHVLTDEHYKDRFEGCAVNVDDCEVSEALLAQGVEPEALRLIESAQLTHDSNSSDMREAFEQLCGDHNVTWPEGV